MNTWWGYWKGSISSLYYSCIFSVNFKFYKQKLEGKLSFPFSSHRVKYTKLQNNASLCHRPWALYAREPMGQGSDTTAVSTETHSLDTVRTFEVAPVKWAQCVWEWPSGHSQGGQTIRRGGVSEEIGGPLHQW